MPLPAFFIWWLYSLSVCAQSVATLAKTSDTLKPASGNDDDDHSEFDDGDDSGAKYKNVTLNSGRSLKCVPMIKHFEVELTEPLSANEGVGLTGDHIKLGEWQIDKSVEMRRRAHNALKWFIKIPMCSALRIYYRFFIYYKDSRGFKRVRYWEGQQHSRVLEAYEMFRHTGSLKFGHAHAVAEGGGVQNERGWLRGEYIIQLKFIWPQHIRFTEFSHFIRNPRYVLKLRAYRDKNGQPDYQNMHALNSDTEAQVSRFMGKKSMLRSLRDLGEFYKPGDIVIFHITASDFQENLYVLAIYTREQELLGEVFIPSAVLKRSEGILELPIFDTNGNRRAGWITLPYLRVKALPEAIKFNLRASFHHYWPFNWPTLDIGQRGVGKSFLYHTSSVLENTIGSFLKAKEHNSDMIQLDVQLTKDYVPVVWNDFGFYTSAGYGNKKPFSLDLVYVYIHDLTYEELLKKRVFMFMKGLMVEVTHLKTVFVADADRIFPQLSEVYRKLPNSLGMVVNIKWPQLLSSGTFESLQSLDKNVYVNSVLEVTMEYGCGRPIIMASFDADICTMLRYKQPMYGVIFLSMGERSPWEPYADLRTRSLTDGIQFAQSADILGTAVYADEILPANNNNNNNNNNNSNDLNMAFELQQVIFVWGDVLNEPTVLEYFRSLEVAGIIYDQVDILLAKRTKTKRKRFGFFEAEELQRIYVRQCIGAGNVSISEGQPDTHSPFWPRLRNLDEL